MSVDWSYFDKFENIVDKYMPACGEGETKASQIVTAVSKLVYKWYNDGDVYDNRYQLKGWYNDLSSYANWLFKYAGKRANILGQIKYCYSEEQYEDILKHLADSLLEEEYLESMEDEDTIGSIYNCKGPFIVED